ncbi:MAG: hypothetical protein ABIV50_07890 [Opitutus sp.]
MFTLSRFAGVLLLGIVTPAALIAEEFSKAITPEEFAAAGLSKLTPEELARLDALVRGQRSTEVDRVKAETAVRVAAETTERVQAETEQRVQAETTQRVEAETTKRVEAETTKKVKAEIAALPPPPATRAPAAQSGSLLNRLRVVLSPGTDIEYTTVESELVGKFRGYGPGTVFTLANGQQWRVVEGSYWSSAKNADKLRKVVVEPGVLGSFFLKIDGGGRPKVSFVGNTK